MARRYSDEELAAYLGCDGSAEQDRMEKAASMDPDTLEALKGSIEKWRQIVEEGSRDKGSDNCPLCLMFITDRCDGCPVKQKTGKSKCHGSPYERWEDKGYCEADESEEAMELARGELQFLIDLLPEKPTLGKFIRND